MKSIVNRFKRFDLVHRIIRSSTGQSKYMMNVFSSVFSDCIFFVEIRPYIFTRQDDFLHVIIRQIKKPQCAVILFLWCLLTGNLFSQRFWQSIHKRILLFTVIMWRIEWQMFELLRERTQWISDIKPRSIPQTSEEWFLTIRCTSFQWVEQASSRLFILQALRLFPWYKSK